MTKQTQRTAWCEDPFGEVSEPGKCPDCGAALRERGGHSYCWFCEKEIDGPTERIFAPGPAGKNDKKAASEGHSSDSRLADILEDKTPIIKGSIVFDDDDEEVASDGDDEVLIEEKPADEEFEMDEDSRGDDVLDAGEIDDEEPPFNPLRKEKKKLEEEEDDFVLDETDAVNATVEEETEGFDVGPVHGDAGSPGIAKGPGEDEAQEEDVEEEWCTDDGILEGSAADEVVDDASPDDAEAGTPATGAGDDEGDEFVIDEDEDEDLDDDVSPYARGKKKKFVNVL